MVVDNDPLNAIPVGICKDVILVAKLAQKNIYDNIGGKIIRAGA